MHNHVIFPPILPKFRDIQKQKLAFNCCNNDSITKRKSYWVKCEVFTGYQQGGWDNSLILSYACLLRNKFHCMIVSPTGFRGLVQNPMATDFGISGPSVAMKLTLRVTDTQCGSGTTLQAAIYKRGQGIENLGVYGNLGSPFSPVAKVSENHRVRTGLYWPLQLTSLPKPLKKVSHNK